MLTKEQNERLTQVGPGTPGGELLRRYWQVLCPPARSRAGRSEEARAPPRRGSAGLSRRRRCDVLHRGALPPSPRLAVLRLHRAGRHSLLLSRLEVRLRRRMHRAAVREADARQSRAESLSGAGARRAALRLYGPRSGARAAAAALGRAGAQRSPPHGHRAAGPYLQLAADPGEHGRFRAHLLSARPYVGGEEPADLGAGRLFLSPDHRLRLGRLRMGHREDAGLWRRQAGDGDPPAADLPEHPAHSRRAGRSDAFPRADRRHAYAHLLGRLAAASRRRSRSERRQDDLRILARQAADRKR